jgi:hypothetical protein
MIIKTPIQHLATLEKDYRDKLIANGSLTNEYLFIDIHVANIIRSQFGKGPVEPTGCCGRKNLPPITEQAKNLAGAIGRTANALIEGKQIKRSNQEQDKVLGICRECEFYIKEKQRCSKCGCYLAMKIKLEQEVCPVGKW